MQRLLLFASTDFQLQVYSSVNIADSDQADITPQSELLRPIKIGLGCVYGVESCTKLQHSDSWKCVRKIVLNNV